MQTNEHNSALFCPIWSNFIQFGSWSYHASYALPGYPPGYPPLASLTGQEGCLGSLAHANQQLLRPTRPGGDSLRCVPWGGAQMLRLLSSTALRDATEGRLPEEMKHLARWRDTGLGWTWMDLVNGQLVHLLHLSLLYGVVLKLGPRRAKTENKSEKVKSPCLASGVSLEMQKRKKTLNSLNTYFLTQILVRTSQFLCAWWLLCTFAGKFAGDAARRTGINMYQQVVGLALQVTSIDINWLNKKESIRGLSFWHSPDQTWRHSNHSMPRSDLFDLFGSLGSLHSYRWSQLR